MFLLQTERQIFDFLYSQSDFVSEKLVIKLFTRSKFRVAPLLGIYYKRRLIESKTFNGHRMCRLTERGKRVVDLLIELEKLLKGED